MTKQTITATRNSGRTTPPYWLILEGERKVAFTIIDVPKGFKFDVASQRDDKLHIDLKEVVK
jgi:hypothetical protein